jgi:2-oxoisovalerate dehydrogenase E2 component (dihydrolipoyl transacylase)
MSEFSFKLPDLGEGIVESEIVEWHVKLGDDVAEDQHIVDVMTDKAVVEVTAPVSGVVANLACAAGEVLAVGAQLILFNTNGAMPANVASNDNEPKPETEINNIEPIISKAGAPVAAAHSKMPVTKSADTTVDLLTSPSVRLRARNEAIDLGLISGSGPSGRIHNSDLDAFIAAGGSQVSLPNTLSTHKTSATNEVKIKGLRKIIAQKMVSSSQNIPHYSYIEEIDLSALDDLRQHLNDNRKETQEKLTLLPFIMQALVKALADFPHCNALYDDQKQILTQYDPVHIGVATMTDLGLLVPVMKHVESLDVWQCAAQLSDLSKTTRAGKAKGEQLSGSTITITSLGAIGGIASTPIINAPETTIIGINKMQERAVVRNGQIVVRKMMNLSASFDHRIVDGFDGAQLIQALKRLLENPGAIFV